MKKKSMTLLEIMIVIMLIGLISSVLGYNMKGSLDKGRAFRTKEGAKIVRDVLLLEVAEGHSIDEVIASPGEYLKNSGLVNDPAKSLKDGWGKEFVIKKKGAEDIEVVSAALKAYDAKHKKKNEPEEVNAAESTLASGDENS